MKILIAVPNLGAVHPKLVMKLLRWSTIPTKGVEQVAIFLPTGHIPHDSARNFCVNHMLNNTDATHLFFLDNDVLPEDDCLEKLVEANKDIVSGLYPSMRQVPRTGETVKVFNAFRYGQVGEDGDYGLVPIMSGEGAVIPISRAGGGCLLIKREVLEKVGAPWFKFQYNADGTLSHGEDIDFCRKAEQAGYQLFAHLDVKCGHVKEITL